MKRPIALASFAIVLAAVAATLTAPAQAAAPDGETTSTSADADATTPTPTATEDPALSQYVQADSPAEAEQKLNALEEGATASVANVRFGPCWLHPTPTYLRTSSNKRNVGAKPYTTCSVPVTSIRHASDLRYKSFIWWKKAGKTHYGQNFGEKSYTQRNVEYRCVSKEESGWSGNHSRYHRLPR
ncbi:MAG: hypothetical protein ACRDQA_13305 [Nocardioidaceae bacterium]